MMWIATARFRRLAFYWLFGCAGLALVTLVCYRFQLNLATAVLLYLIVVVLVSLSGSFISSTLIALIAVLCLQYFVLPARFSELGRDPSLTANVWIDYPLDAVALIAFLVIALAITRLISQLRASAEGLRQQAGLLDLTHDTIFVRDKNGRITYWNRGAEELYGWSREEAIGKVTHQLLQTVFPAPLEEITSQLVLTGRWEGELVHTRRDGTTVVVASRWSLQRDERGQPVSSLETNNDITERKRADEVLREHAGLLDLTHDTIIVRDMNDVITYWNHGAEVLYGWTRAEAIGQVSHQLTRTLFPEPLPAINAHLLRTGRWEGELVHTKRDGTQVVVASRWALQRDVQGRPLRILETNNDTTLRKQAEETARKAEAELAHVARVMTMGEMAASIAHEVNQPLSGVVINGNACLRWLAGTSPNLDEARSALQRIIRDGKRASDVIARVRNLSKKKPTEKERLDLNEAIQEVLALAQPEVRKHHAIVRSQLAIDLPAVIGDRVQLQQVVLNLVLNGLDAMSTVADRPRELLLSTRQDDGVVRVSVKDSGVGLDAQHADRIFDAFYTTKPSGMGMGLSISRSIIENHNGRLWVEPNDGPGTSFQFTVPKYE
jgi:PAS domain S-box-containing protein